MKNGVIEMTTKDAASIFNIDEKKIRTLCKENKIHGVTREKGEKGRYVIPDETVLIVTDENARYFLYQLLKFKNNPKMIFPVACLDSTEKLNAWYEYLREQGLIGDCEFSSDLNTLLSRMSLTEEAIAMVFGKKDSSILDKIHFNPAFNFNVASLNIG